MESSHALHSGPATPSYTSTRFNPLHARTNIPRSTLPCQPLDTFNGQVLQAHAWPLTSASAEFGSWRTRPALFSLPSSASLPLSVPTWISGATHRVYMDFSLGVFRISFTRASTRRSLHHAYTHLAHRHRHPTRRAIGCHGATVLVCNAVKGSSERAVRRSCSSPTFKRSTSTLSLLSINLVLPAYSKAFPLIHGMAHQSREPPRVGTS
jgi:hypothetical protein